jgi:hypothetical protein
MPWVRAFAPPYEDAARSLSRQAGGHRSGDETYVKVAGDWAYSYRRTNTGARRPDLPAALPGRWSSVSSDSSTRPR